MTDNFEKDINVPSKGITHTCDATDCEQYYPEHICCHCRNAEWYGLRDELKRKEQECERLEDKLDNIRDFANQGRDMFVQQGSFANWYKVAECMKNGFNFILYEIDDEE